MGFDEPGLGGLEVLFGIEVIGVLLDFEVLGLVAVVHALLELVLGYFHLGDDALDADQLVC